MVKYKLTHAALDDISAIWEYTADRWSENQADIYYKMLIMSFEKITTMPTVYGHRYDEIDNKLYGYKAGRHIIFYRILLDGIIIIRVLHESMDVKSHL